MPARTPTRPSAPAPTCAAASAPLPPAAAAGRADIRLPWWAIALPVAAFTALFLLHTTAHPRATDSRPTVGRVLEHLRHTPAP